MSRLLVLAAALATVLVFSASAIARSYPHVGGYKQVTKVNLASFA